MSRQIYSSTTFEALTQSKNEPVYKKGLIGCKCLPALTNEYTPSVMRPFAYRLMFTQSTLRMKAIEHDGQKLKF